MPLFVVEGLDRTGKTSLCESQPVTTCSSYMHFSAPKKHPLEEYITPLLDYLPGAGDTIWVDRHYLGERVWPLIFGRQSKLDLPMTRYIEMFLQSRGAIAIYAHRDVDELKFACRKEPVAGRVEEALELFDAARHNSLLWWRPYRHLLDDPEIKVSDGERRERMVAPIHRVTREWIGWCRPEVLLVGEQVNRPSAHDWFLPFVPYRGTSGHFLMTELEHLNLEVAICNAVKRNGHVERLADLWETLGTPAVVSLGATADVSLTDAKVPHRKVHHPQYVRRFERRRGEGWYANQIEEAAC